MEIRSHDDATLVLMMQFCVKPELGDVMLNDAQILAHSFQL